MAAKVLPNKVICIPLTNLDVYSDEMKLDIKSDLIEGVNQTYHRWLSLRGITDENMEQLINSMGSMYSVHIQNKYGSSYHGRSWIWPSLYHKCMKDGVPSTIIVPPSSLVIDQACLSAKYNNYGYYHKHEIYANIFIFEPNNYGLTGGDMVLTCNTSRVYDPNNLLVVDNNKVRLQVSMLKIPVVIAFVKSVQYDLKKVVSGYRVYYTSSTKLIKGHENFATSHKINISDKMLMDYHNSMVAKKVASLQKKIDKLTEIPSLEISTKVHSMLEVVSSYHDICQMIVLPTKVKSEKLLPKFIIPLLSIEEKVLLREICKLYPSSSISTITGKRTICDSLMYTEDKVKIITSRKCLGELKLDIEGIISHYFGNPLEEEFGFNIDYDYYIEGSYDNYIKDIVLLVVICVKKN